MNKESGDIKVKKKNSGLVWVISSVLVNAVPPVFVHFFKRGTNGQWPDWSQNADDSILTISLVAFALGLFAYANKEKIFGWLYGASLCIAVIICSISICYYFYINGSGENVFPWICWLILAGIIICSVDGFIIGQMSDKEEKDIHEVETAKYKERRAQCIEIFEAVDKKECKRVSGLIKGEICFCDVQDMNIVKEIKEHKKERQK